MEKLVVDGKVAVLVSRGYGAGWSTWNTEYPGMLFDPEIASMVVNGNDQVKIIKVAQKKYPEGYFGGVDGLSVQWIPVGTKFRVDEYDGAESLEFLNEVEWIVA